MKDDDEDERDESFQRSLLVPLLLALALLLLGRFWLLFLLALLLPLTGADAAGVPSIGVGGSSVTEVTLELVSPPIAVAPVSCVLPELVLMAVLSRSSFCSNILERASMYAASRSAIVIRCFFLCDIPPARPVLPASDPSPSSESGSVELERDFDLRRSLADRRIILNVGPDDELSAGTRSEIR